MKANNLSRLLKSRTPKIYKNKKLNTANFGNFTHNDYQIFLHLVSKIGGVDEFGKYLQPEQLQREHILTAQEFSEVFNANVDNSYKVLRKAVDKLMKTDLKVERNESLELWRINVCSMAKYNKKEGCITVKFTDDIMPYLAQVRKKFVLYNLKEIANFGSLYTTRLYELIQEFKETGWVLKSVEQLRDIFAVGEKFKAYKNKNTTAVDSIQVLENDNTKREYLYTTNFALNHKMFEVAPFVTLSNIANVNLNYLDTIQKSMTPKVAKSLYGKKLIQLYKERCQNEN